MVIFVRHGATPTTGKVLPGRARGLHLSEEGVAQAERTAAALAAACKVTSAKGRPKPPHITAVYCSPMERARETAAPIGRALGLTVIVERGLVECDFGEWTGRDLASLTRMAEWNQVQEDPSGFRFPGGESFAGMQARVLDTVATLRARHPGEIVVAVSHADPIKVALADALGAHLRSMQKLWVSTSSISVVSYTPTGPTVLAVNALGDLHALGNPR